MLGIAKKSSQARFDLWTCFKMFNREQTRLISVSFLIRTPVKEYHSEYHSQAGSTRTDCRVMLINAKNQGLVEIEKIISFLYSIKNIFLYLIKNIFLYFIQNVLLYFIKNTLHLFCHSRAVFNREGVVYKTLPNKS